AGFYLLTIALSVAAAESRKDALYFFGVTAAAIAVFYLCLNLFRRNRAVIDVCLTTIASSAAVSAALAVWQLYSTTFKEWYYPHIAVRDQKILELWELVSRVVGTWQ